MRHPSRGDGWGGPARGAGSTAPMHPPFEPGNDVAAGFHDMSGEQVAARLKEELFDIATKAKREDTRVTASVALLNRIEGMPVARNLNINSEAGASVQIYIPDNGRDPKPPGDGA